MHVIQDAWRSTDLPCGAVVTIGNYDGIHRGQRAILEALVAEGAARGAAPVMVTFDPHPLQVLRGQPVARLTTPGQKEELVAAAGVEAMLVLRFDEELAAVSPEAFVADFLVRRLEAQAVWVGKSFRFGRGRSGDIAGLRRLGDEHGFAVHAAEEVAWRGAPISSTRIREAVAEGAVDAAEAMLGRPYELSGKVARGDRMGKRLGWPTVNLAPDNELLPRDGVYATRIEIANLASVFDSVSNIGTRPTVYENHQRVVETHVLDFHGEVYGQPMRLRFCKRLREEMLFPTIMDLSAQIGRDVEATREFFAARRREEVRVGG